MEDFSVVLRETSGQLKIDALLDYWKLKQYDDKNHIIVLSDRAEVEEKVSKLEKLFKNKELLFMSILGIIVMAVIAWVFTRPAKLSLMVTELYNYYPENTAFYLEVAPGEKLSSRLFKNVDRIKSLGESKNNDVKISDVFEKDFNPRFSAGAWMSASEPGKTSPSTPSPTTSSEPSFLSVIPLKKGVTPESLASDLKVPMEELTITREGNVTFMESKTNKLSSLAFHDNNLLVASSKDALNQAISEFKTPRTILDNPVYKQHLKLLPLKRQGTILVLHQELKGFPHNMNSEQEQVFKSFTNFQDQMLQATPVMLASIAINNDQLIQLKSFTPVDLSKVENEALRKDIKTFFSQQATFDLPQLLPKETIAYGGMLGLGQYYDMYMNYFADQKGKESVDGLQKQLKVMGLDLRKNLVALLDGKSAIGVTAEQGKPDVLLFLKHDTETARTMEQFGMLAAQLTGGKMSDRNIDKEHVVKVLESPQIPVKVAYSNVQSDTLVVGTEKGLSGMYDVQQKKHPALNESALYKELTSTMPSQVNGVFYVDINQGSVLLDDLAKKSPQPNNMAKDKSIKEALSGIEGIAATNSIEGTELMKGYLNIKLSTAE